MKNGESISAACNLLTRVYEEIERLQIDLEKILREATPAMQFQTEYSYSPSWLRVKDAYIRVYVPTDDSTLPGKGKHLYFIFQVLFYNGAGGVIKKLNRSIKEPELWMGLIETNAKEKEYAESMRWTITEKENFVDANGKTYVYNCKDAQEYWHGWFLGKKLVEITSIEELRSTIVDPLFKKYSEYTDR